MTPKSVGSMSCLFKLCRIIFLIYCFFGFSIILWAQETSYSQRDTNGTPLDGKLIEVMNYTNCGVFIEVGAYDGVNQSNTKLLEQYYGWTGILVEPSQVLFENLCANRCNSKCFQCALGSFEENNTYVWGDFNGHLMSSVDGHRLKRVRRRSESAPQRVLMRSLQSILDELGIRYVNFFSLDTEGYEFNILKGIDFDKTTFDYLLIEIYNYEYVAIVSFLADKGYMMIQNFSNYNMNNDENWDGTHNDYLFKRMF